MSADSPRINIRWYKDYPGVMTLFLECQFFHDLQSEQARLEMVAAGRSGIYGIGLGDCCEKCHSFPQRSGLIYIKPFTDKFPGDVNADWSIPIEAIVCCNLHDFVRALPRQFWLDELKRRGLTLKAGYNYSHSSEDDTVQVRGPKARGKKQKEDEEPSFDDFMNR